jgi:hypothetical protein
MEGLLVLLFLVGAGGCGNRATVSGKVTYQGRPVTYGAVIFVAGDGTARSAVIAPDGSYKIEGLSPGTLKIGVISPDPSKGRSARRQHKPAPPQDGAADSPGTQGVAWFPLPTQFEPPSTSGLDCTVESGTVDHDIQLK